jgi:hypothetical protein
MGLYNRFRALRDRLRSLEASGVLGPRQAKDVADGLRKVEHGLKTSNDKTLKAGLNRIARALLAD